MKNGSSVDETRAKIAFLFTGSILTFDAVKKRIVFFAHACRRGCNFSEGPAYLVGIRPESGKRIVRHDRARPTSRIGHRT